MPRQRAAGIYSIQAGEDVNVLMRTDLLSMVFVMPHWAFPFCS